MTARRPQFIGVPRTATGIFAVVLLLRLCASSATTEEVDNETGGFEASKYNSDVCEQFNKFYHKKFDVKYNACKVLYNYPNFSKQFEDYLRKYRKTYPNATENKKRFATFASNLLYIMVETEKKKLYTVGVNRYADMTPDEFTSTHTGLTLGSQAPALLGDSWRGDQLPDSVDWVARGAVNIPPVNQGQCNSCWTFAVSGGIEGAWQILTGTLVKLAEQQFLDCTGDGLGCSTGGNLETPIDNVAEKKGLCSNASYPYTAKDGFCANRQCDIVIPQGSVTGYVNVRSNDMMALMSALAHNGPVAVGIDASGQNIQFYSGGILSSECSANLDHAVLVVGYGHQGMTKYWSVKNSWGADWGEHGFFRLVRGIGGAGECGILSIPTYYTVKKASVPWQRGRGRLGAEQPGEEPGPELGDAEETNGTMEPAANSTSMPWEGRPSSGILILAACVAACALLSALGCCCYRSKGRGLFLELGEDEEEDEEESEWNE